MKLFVIFSFVLWLTSCRTPSITPEQADDYVDTKVMVCGEVKGTFTSKKGTVFLNFGAAYPNQVFSVVIYSADAATFGTSPAILYTGKKICITGTVRHYKGKPQIEVYNKKQIEEK